MTDNTWSGTAFCVKCKEKRALNGTIELSISQRNGRATRIAKGRCPVCDTKMSRILGPAKEQVA